MYGSKMPTHNSANRLKFDYASIIDEDINLAEMLDRLLDKGIKILEGCHVCLHDERPGSMASDSFCDVFRSSFG